MSKLSDRDLLTYAMREAMAKEKHMALRLRDYQASTRDRNLKRLCSELVTESETRVNILKGEFKKLYVNQE